ncbi:hypothetical protein CBW65_20025 [Tumebacillus avium]|uniref:HTH cro/C1-type domain-containing protein n=1 Tax=Tumebacillus avium TaxID=1903704 RepID=A0A1Y0IU31_9BACL|nr:helix-turn-helix transcriptional regulator [Tumebacillus avium]ARU63005.1 hypothetical protein CBW65_20025 [Tumebacillus avium]
MNSLGTRIRELRLKKGLTQIELAKGIITPSMVSQIESDRARPSYKVLVAIANRLDAPLEQLIKGVTLELEASSKYKLAMGMVRAREYGAAILLFENLLETAVHRIPKENLLLELALCHLGAGDVLEAEQLLNQLYQITSYGQDQHLLAVVLLNQGKVAELKHNLPIALFYMDRAWEELQKAQEIDDDLQVKILMQQASLQEQSGKVEDAAKNYERALLLSQCNSEDRGSIYLRLAEVYNRHKNYEKAEEYASKALVLLEEQANEDRKQDLQHRLIMLHRGSVDWKLIIQELLTIAETYTRRGQKQKSGEVYADVGLICLENGELDQASSYAEKAKATLSETDPTMGKVNRVLAFVNFYRNNEKKGKEYLENALKLYEQHGKVAELEEITILSCRYLTDKGEHQEAYERLERFHKYLIGQLERRGIVL